MGRSRATTGAVLSWVNKRNAKWPKEGRGFRVCVKTSFGVSFRALRCHPERSEEPVLNEVKESRSGCSG
ncbi:hypothetical protein SBA2_30062 [Acidobacteriia bacterium SbA2]|nr:hypothetical protein SBA2_30062 [Acidobacteriia bacterium SbA2]